ncbi:MAG: hypothetical protein ACK4F5_02420 [Aliihoeflea sp.]
MSSTSIVKRHRTTYTAIDTYVSRQSKDGVFSIQRAVADVRREILKAEITDDELAELLALHAVAKGHRMISFDVKALRYSIELAVACEIAGGIPVVKLASRSKP